MLVAVNVPGVGAEERAAFLGWFRTHHPKGGELATWSTDESLVAATAGLSIHALRQLLMGALYDGRAVQPGDLDQCDSLLLTGAHPDPSWTDEQRAQQPDQRQHHPERGQDGCRSSRARHSAASNTAAMKCTRASCSDTPVSAVSA